jgi:phosphopantothenate synthetase
MVELASELSKKQKFKLKEIADGFDNAGNLESVMEHILTRMGKVI